MIAGMAILTVVLETASAQYPEWQHSGSLYVLTTPEEGNLPDTASVEDFLMLVRSESR